MKTKIYMIPGFMNNEKLWSRLTPLFNDDYEFINLDIPLENSFDEIVEVLNKKIEDKKINLLGFSLGGYIASYFGLKYPNRVNKILAVACTPSNLAKEECEKRKVAIELTRSFGFKGLSRKKAISLVEPQNQNDEELINLLLQMYVEVGEEAFYKQFMATIIREDISEKIIASNLNIGYIYADGDRLVNKDYMNNFENRAKNKIYFKELKAQTHMLPLERANEIKEEIINFWS